MRAPLLKIITLILLLALPANADRAFDFRNFTKLRAADREFEIIGVNGYVRDRAVGSGRILALGDHRLHFKFSITAVVYGEVKLRYAGRTKHKILLDLEYSGASPRGPEAAKERVEADAFLAENGVLTFQFMNAQRMIHLSVDSRGRSKFISSWGASRLAAQ